MCRVGRSVTPQGRNRGSLPVRQLPLELTNVYDQSVQGRSSRGVRPSSERILSQKPECTDLRKGPCTHPPIHSRQAVLSVPDRSVERRSYLPRREHLCGVSRVFEPESPNIMPYSLSSCSLLARRQHRENLLQNRLPVNSVKILGLLAVGVSRILNCWV